MELELDNLLTTIKNYHFEAEQGADKILSALKIKNFKPHKKPKEVIAIDGSHCSILSISNLWLVIIKVCALHYTRDATENAEHFPSSRRKSRWLFLGINRTSFCFS